MDWKVSMIIVALGIIIGASSLFVVAVYATILKTAGMAFVLASILTYSKPSKKRLLMALAVSAVLVAATFLYQTRAFSIGPQLYYRGLPYAYYSCFVGAGHMMVSNATLLAELNRPRCSLSGPMALPFGWLILDLLFWLTASSVALAIYGRLKKKKQKAISYV